MLVTVTILTLLIGLTACQTTRGIHEIPVVRDYRELGDVEPETARRLTEQAHRKGAMYYAPYQYMMAVSCLTMAQELQRRGDSVGARDYTSLAHDFAQTALGKSDLPYPGPLTIPRSEEECVGQYERLLRRYQEIDPDKAIEVAPFIYAHLTFALSKAEHELNKPGGWPRAARALGGIESDINTIWVQDSDGDGIPDMLDEHPFIPDHLLKTDEEEGIQEGYPELESILFTGSSASLSSDARGYLRGILPLLLERTDAKLRISGHTDDMHSEQYNMDLSRRRAEAVRAYLVANGCPEEKLIVTFHGMAEPVSDNTTTQGRTLNRRVDLQFDVPHTSSDSQ